MYNLVRFLLRFWLLILFLSLEGFCFYLIYQNSKFHQVFLYNKANEISGNVYLQYAASKGYLSLGRVNDSLARENAFLREKAMESFIYLKNEEHTITDSTATKLQLFTYKDAKVIRNSVNQSANYIYIDKGASMGIKEQMGVISAKGIVGQVVKVTEHYSAVMSILNRNFRVSAKLKKSNFFGQLFWSGKRIDEVRLEEIPKHVNVHVGDTIVTSGYSVLFPENIMIGRVRKVYAQPEKNFLEIDVQLSADMNSLSHVYVVNHLQKQELEILDSAVINQAKK
ncbi:MAG: rod shape-determining protein MreC [Chitinophagales bacterium]|nr:rod shape-determining protein MreC [Chitinophagales bacterium]